MRHTHGQSKTRLYGVWRGMKSRCTNPNHPKYKDYGGRGIDVYDGWKHDFLAFHEWAVANGYDENAPIGQCSLDRIDNNKGYYPGNCRWATAKEQSYNKRNNRRHYDEVEVILNLNEWLLISTIRQSADPTKTIRKVLNGVGGGVV